MALGLKYFLLSNKILVYVIVLQYSLPVHYLCQLCTSVINTDAAFVGEMQLYICTAMLILLLNFCYR